MFPFVRGIRRFASTEAQHENRAQTKPERTSEQYQRADAAFAQYGERRSRLPKTRNSARNLAPSATNCSREAHSMGVFGLVRFDQACPPSLPSGTNSKRCAHPRASQKLEVCEFPLPSQLHRIKAAPTSLIFKAEGESQCSPSPIARTPWRGVPSLARIGRGMRLQHGRR